MGAVQFACNGLRAAARIHSVEEDPGCLLGCRVGLDCTRHDAPLFSKAPRSFWPGTGECISPTAVLTSPSFNVAVQSDRLCILVAGILDAFVTLYNLQKTNRGPRFNFREPLHGRIKMMAALCLAWAHVHQTMCLEIQAEQLQT